MNAGTSCMVVLLHDREQGTFEKQISLIFYISSKAQTSLNGFSIESLGLE
jgi:hypothetical protein